MKKLAQCAVLLAFALAFVGCNLQDDEPESPTTLQDALNDGGTVNLNDYDDFSGSKTYTVSEDTTITGDAKGASFAIADGVDVTFNGTKNIETVTVGTGNRATIVRTAQNTNGTTITLKGNGITITNVFIYVANCTLSSDSTTNSFENVVVASTVQTLALNEKTKVSALVSSSSDSTITITVSTNATIEKADKTIIDAVKASNQNAASNITEISSEESEGLKDAFEEESKKDPTGSNDNNNDSNNFIKTKDDLTKCIKNIIQEYYDFVCEIEDRNSRNRAAAASKDDISKQLKDAFDAVFLPFHDDEALGESFIKLFTGEGATKNINLKGEINLANVTVNKGLDAFIDFANYVQEQGYFTSDEDEDDAGYDTTVRKASDTEQITRKTLFGSNYETVNDFLNIADKYASVPRLYLHGKLNVNADAKGTAEYASATAKADIQIEATNINNMIPEFFQAYSNNIDHTYVPTSVNLPVTAVKPFINVDANVALTRNQYDDFVQKCKDMPGWEDEPKWNYTGDYSDYYDYRNKYDAEWDAWYEQHRKDLKDYFLKANYASKECSCKINAGVSTTVTSTATVPGGIITLSLEGNYTDPGKIIAFITPGPISSDYVEVLKELEKDYGIVPTVTVTDYNGKQTLKLSGINEILDIITEIVDNIGDIIQ